MSQIAGSILIAAAALVHVIHEDSRQEAASMQGVEIRIASAAATIAHVNGGVFSSGPIPESPATRYWIRGLLASGVVLVAFRMASEWRRSRQPLEN